MSNKDSDNEEEIHLLKYEDYDCDCKELLKAMMGYTSNFNNTSFIFLGQSHFNMEINQSISWKQ